MEPFALDQGPRTGPDAPFHARFAVPEARVPRYTSYPTAPQFVLLKEDEHRRWLQEEIGVRPAVLSRPRPLLPQPVPVLCLPRTPHPFRGLGGRLGYAHVPWLRPHQRAIDANALPDTTERSARAEAVLCGAGHRTLRLDHFVRPGEPLAEAAEAGRIRRNFQGCTTDNAKALLCPGLSAIGTLPQGHVQNVVEEHRSATLAAARYPPVARGQGGGHG